MEKQGLEDQFCETNRLQYFWVDMLRVYSQREEPSIQCTDGIRRFAIPCRRYQTLSGWYGNAEDSWKVDIAGTVITSNMVSWMEIEPKPNSVKTQFDTRIPLSPCMDHRHLTTTSKLSWASSESATRGQNCSLLRLFDVYLAPNGEARQSDMRPSRNKAWRRSILWTPSHEDLRLGLLATSPEPFCRIQ